MTILELVDMERLRLWLGMSEERLRAAYLEVNPRSFSWRGYSTRPMAETEEFKRMTVAELFDWWFTRYRRELQAEWVRKEKTLSLTRIQQEGFRSLGFKKGAVAANRQAAIAAFPELFQAVPQ